MSNNKNYLINKKTKLIGVQRINEMTDNFSYDGEETDDAFEDESTEKDDDDKSKEKPQAFVFTLGNQMDETNEAKANESETDDSKKSKKKKKTKKEKQRICCTSLTKGLGEVRPIGWMAIFGDALSNFIDGMSIGASMNQSLIDGLTTAIATWAGNVTQELGDFALLVRAGMTPFQALIYNYLSANTLYLGFIVGATFGQDLNTGKWIFSVSSATTMYISLGVLVLLRLVLLFKPFNL